jgi:hypothetical protein
MLKQRDLLVDVAAVAERNHGYEQDVVFDRVADSIVANPDPVP